MNLSKNLSLQVYNPSSGLDSLKVQAISKAQAWQRAGRAGRECSGVCYREYTEAEFAAMPEHTQPEILRCNLSTVALQLLALKINISNFDFIDKPPKEVKILTQFLGFYRCMRVCMTVVNFFLHLNFNF